MEMASEFDDYAFPNLVSDILIWDQHVLRSENDCDFDGCLANLDCSSSASLLKLEPHANHEF